MQLLSASELGELVKSSQPYAISIYIPANSDLVDPRMSKIAFKNAVNKVISHLRDLKLDQKTHQRLDQASQELEANDEFWKDLDSSFALFAAGDWVKTYKVPSSQSELVMISDHFYITPLVPLLTLHNTFYVLELDKEHTKMWQGTATGLVLVTIPNLPKSVTEVTGVEVNERNVQTHTGSFSVTGGNGAAQFHGGSSWKDDKDRYLEKFTQAIDKAVCAFFSDSKYPLFLSGTEEPVVMYRKLSKYTAIEEVNLPKVDDPTHRLKKLFESAWTVMAAKTEEAKATAVANFEEQPEASRKVTILPEVIRQAAQGKVDTLLVAEDARVWGTFVPENLTVIIEDQQKPLSAELINLAARLTLLNSGKVVVLPAEQLPSTSPVAALLRY